MDSRGLARLKAFNSLVVSQVRLETANRPDVAPSALYPHSRVEDLAVALIAAIFFLMLRLTLGRQIIPRLLRKYKGEEQDKLSENIYYTGYYTGATVLFYFLAQSETWVWDATSLGNDKRSFLAIFGHLPPPPSEIVHLYYMVALGFYLSAVVFLFRYDTRRSDFKELAFHHFVTLGLILLSYFYGYLRCGVVILALHDVGDIFLYLAKTLHYLGLAGLDTAVFAVFAVTFYLTRLVLLPRLTYTVTVETLRELAYNSSFNNWGRNFERNLLHLGAFGCLLYSLILLHCFWFALILKMIYREVVLGKKISEEGDIREK
jgi:hypothetical protein